jgi:hypothetical protein
MLQTPWGGFAMDATDASGHAARPDSPDPLGAEAMAGSTMVGDQPLGPDAVSILASESWSLLATRSMPWNDRMRRTTIFLTVLRAAKPRFPAPEPDA